MWEFIFLFLRFVASFFKSKAVIQVENLALRHQLCVLRRSAKRPKIRSADRRPRVQHSHGHDLRRSSRGLQIVGPRHADLRVVQAARVYEQLSGFTVLRLPHGVKA